MRPQVPAVQYVANMAPSRPPFSLLRSLRLDQKTKERNHLLVEISCRSQPSPLRPRPRQTNTADICRNQYHPMMHPGPRRPSRPPPDRLLCRSARTPTKIAKTSQSSKLGRLTLSLLVIKVLQGLLAHDQARDQHLQALASRNNVTSAARAEIPLLLPLRLLLRRYRSRVVVAMSPTSDPLFSERRRTIWLI